MALLPMSNLSFIMVLITLFRTIFQTSILSAMEDNFLFRFWPEDSFKKYSNALADNSNKSPVK